MRTIFRFGKFTISYKWGKRKKFFRWFDKSEVFGLNFNYRSYFFGRLEIIIREENKANASA